MRSLTSSQEHYIRAIYRLSMKHGTVRISDLAEELDVSKPSVCAAVHGLEQQELVKRNASREILLTETGFKTAEELTARYSLLLDFFAVVLDTGHARDAACALEHVLDTDDCVRMTK